MNYKSQLGYIMDLIDVTGKSLGDAIGVDRTLVSKWKNNARQLQVSGPHFLNLVAALKTFNKENNNSVLERFFGDVYPQIDKNEPDYLDTCLNQWLIGKDLGNFNNLNDWRASKSSLYATTIEIFQGNLGKRNAVIEFMDHALTLPAGQEIFISDAETTDWYTEDPEFPQIYTDKFNALVAKKHNITLIHNITKDNQLSTDDIITRLNSYYSGNLTSYYTAIPHLSGPSIYCIHRHMVLLSTNADLNPATRYISLYRDPYSVQEIVKMFTSRLRQSKKMISTYSTEGKGLKSFAEQLLALNKNSSNNYYVSPLPPFTSMKESTLDKILEDNQVSDLHKKDVKTYYTSNRLMLFKDMDNHILEEIISKEAVEDALSKIETYSYELSVLTDQRILIKRAYFIEHLQEICDQTDRNPNYNISVMPFDEITTFKNKMIWLQEDQILYSYPFDQSKNFIVSDAPLIVDLVLGKLHQILMEYEDEKELELYIKNRMT